MTTKSKTDKQALRLCINTWKRRLKLTVEDIRKCKEAPTPDNCAFCQIYLKEICSGIYFTCNGCPIKKKTGQNACNGTPYWRAQELYERIWEKKSKALKTFHAAVRKEIKFLEALKV